MSNLFFKLHIDANFWPNICNKNVKCAIRYCSVCFLLTSFWFGACRLPSWLPWTCAWRRSTCSAWPGPCSASAPRPTPCGSPRPWTGGRTGPRCSSLPWKENGDECQNLNPSIRWSLSRLGASNLLHRVSELRTLILLISKCCGSKIVKWPVWYWMGSLEKGLLVWLVISSFYFSWSKADILRRTSDHDHESHKRKLVLARIYQNLSTP